MSEHEMRKSTYERLHLGPLDGDPRAVGDQLKPFPDPCVNVRFCRNRPFLFHRAVRR